MCVLGPNMDPFSHDEDLASDSKMKHCLGYVAEKEEN